MDQEMKDLMVKWDSTITLIRYVMILTLVGWGIGLVVGLIYFINTQNEYTPDQVTIEQMEQTLLNRRY